MTETNEVDPTRFLSQSPSFESLILQFQVKESTVDLVTDYAWDFETRPQGTRQFRRLQFLGVKDFTQTEIRGSGEFNAGFSADESSPHHVVTSEEIHAIGDGYRAVYCFSNLGCFEFRFGTLRVSILETESGSNATGETIYRNEQGEVVEFFDPFQMLPNSA